MKQTSPKIKVTVRKRADKKFEKMLEEIINAEYNRHETLISVITAKRALFPYLYGFELPDDYFDSIIAAVFEDELKEKI